MSAEPTVFLEPAAIDELTRENAKLRKIVKALVDRVERSTDAQGNAFSLFQAAITLENTVKQRTMELQSLNRQLHHEIEERRAIEEALARAQSQAERANLSKTEFLAAASHDLSQPVSIARLFLDALKERTVDPESLAMTDRIDRSLEAAESLLATLLEMSRLDAGGLKPEIADAPIDPLLKRLSDEYARAAEEQGLRLRVVPCDAIVRTDLGLLERVLRNFLGNALRYTRRGGILAGCRRRGNALRIEVWDTGPGIPGDRLQEIFKEFRRLGTPESQPGGMGLGLAIVERIGRLLDAPVGVRSWPGHGSVFSIDLPIGDAKNVASRDAHLVRRRAPNLMSGKTVLVLDSDPATLRAMATQLRSWGLYTLEARSLRGAVAIANAHGQLPGAIVADEHPLDGMTGLEAIALMRERFDAAIPGVVMTATAREEDLGNGNGFWFLEKPVRIERLRSLLHHVFAAA